MFHCFWEDFFLGFDWYHGHGQVCCEWPFSVIKHELLTHEYYIALQFLQSTWSKVMNLHLRVDFFFFDAILQYFVFTHIWTSYTLDLQQYRFITYIPPLYKECIFLFMLKYVLHLIANMVLFGAKKYYVLICMLLNSGFGHEK